MSITGISILAALLIASPQSSSNGGALGVQDVPPGATEKVDRHPLTPLGTDLEPLRKRFNEGKGKHRFLALLSPT